jgi:squalene-hopene/tetraprenyl-beta-curcumene cyclase
MQNRDGGWGAFDRNNNLQLLTCVPFADHNAMIDPSTADVTARVVECLAHYGFTKSDPAISRALDYLCRGQERDGSWYGRWGVNYLYGTSGALRAAGALNIGGAPAFRRGAEWLCGVQHGDGGFGETCVSYEDPRAKGRGPSSATQTAWALIGLLAADGVPDSSIDRAVDYLLRRQNDAGSWDDQGPTGTGFPRVFYLNYQFYSHSFPLYALAKYRSLVERRVGGALRERRSP